MTVNNHPDPKVRAELFWESVQSGENEDESSLTHCCRLVIWDGEIQRSPVTVFEDAFHFWELCLRESGGSWKLVSLMVRSLSLPGPSLCCRNWLKIPHLSHEP
jgi:hypothetical protein